MYKNLCVEALGVTGRQSELIEFALTHGFEGFDIDFQDFARRAEKQGMNFARSLISSAKLTIGGFKLPVRLDAGEPVFRDDLNKLKKIGDIAKEAGAGRCYLKILPGSLDRSFEDNFSLHVERLTAIAEVLAPSDVKLGIAFSSSAKARASYENPFIHKADDMLKLLEAAPTVGLTYDSFTWFNAGGTFDQIKSLSGNRIVAVRLADAPAGAVAGELDETDRLLPDEGDTINTVEILTWLNEQKYTGPVAPYPYPSAFDGIPREAVVEFAAAALATPWVTVLGSDEEG